MAHHGSGVKTHSEKKHAAGGPRLSLKHGTFFRQCSKNWNTKHCKACHKHGGLMFMYLVFRFPSWAKLEKLQLKHDQTWWCTWMLDRFSFAPGPQGLLKQHLKNQKYQQASDGLAITSNGNVASDWCVLCWENFLLSDFWFATTAMFNLESRRSQAQFCTGPVTWIAKWRFCSAARHAGDATGTCWWCWCSWWCSYPQGTSQSKESQNSWRLI